MTDLHQVRGLLRGQEAVDGEGAWGGRDDSQRQIGLGGAAVAPAVRVSKHVGRQVSKYVGKKVGKQVGR